MARIAGAEAHAPGGALAQLLAAEANADLRLAEARAEAEAIEAEGERAAAARLDAVEAELRDLARELEATLEAERTARMAALASGGDAALAAFERARGPRRAELVAEVVAAVLEEVA